MLVQARVVPWWGTGRPAEVQSQQIQPVTGIAHRQEDRRVRLQNRVVSTTARRALHTLSRNEKFEFFWCPLPWGSECSGNYQPRGNGKTARGIGSADRTAPGQVWQAPGLREFRLAESQQILPLIGNRKPASDRTHWLQPAPCSSRRRSCPGGERGDRQSSVPADPTRHGHSPPAGG